ncbi:hypothetical protein ACI8AC_12695 [Geodermatophilus sp. SYSU D00758]
MTDLPVPLDIRMSAPKLHDFTSFAVPKRPLTTGEKAVYRRLADDWAVLDAAAQRQLFVSLIAGRLTEFLTEIFATTVARVFTREEAITNPRVKELSRKFNEVALQQHAQTMLGLQATTNEVFAQTVSGALTAASQPERANLWQRLLKGGSGA